MVDRDPFKKRLPHLIVPIEDNRNKKLMDLWVQLISDTQISDIDVAIEKCWTLVVVTQVCSNTMALFNPKVLLRPFKDKKSKQLYGQYDTYTTTYKNAVTSLKGESSDNCLQSKSTISISFPVQPIFSKPSRGVNIQPIEFFKYHDNFI